MSGSVSAEGAGAGAPGDARREPISWLRGIATGLAILIVGLAVTVGGAQEILTKVSGLSRSNLEYLASAVFVVVIAGAAWLLRRLQDRGVI